MVLCWFDGGFASDKQDSVGKAELARSVRGGPRGEGVRSECIAIGLEPSPDGRKVQRRMSECESRVLFRILALACSF
jgi:hypothetical protein